METNTYYTLTVDWASYPNNSANITLEDKYEGELTKEDLGDILETHEAPGYWSFSPHDYGEMKVKVKITKVTKETV